MLQHTGKLIVLGETQQITDSFSKREFVLEDSSEYPQTVLFQATQDRCSLMDGFKVGDELTVNFNLRGRKWTNKEGEDKYFNSLDAWKIEKVGGSAPVNDTPECGDLPF
jgi:hypothetical protein